MRRARSGLGATLLATAMGAVAATAATGAGSGCSSFRASGAGAGAEDAGDGAGGGDGGASPFTVVQAEPAGETFAAVWGADADTVFVVGTNGVHADYYDGSWHRTQIVVGRDYTAVWGTSANDVYAVGTQHDGRGVVQHFDGSAWRDEYVAPTALHGVWGTNGLVLAVGDQGMIYGKTEGSTSWAPRLSQGLPANPKAPTTAASPILWSISGNGPDDFVIAGDVDRVFHYEGNGNFVNLDPTVDRTVAFRTVWAVPGASTNVFFGTNYLGAEWLPPRASDATAADPDLEKLHEERDPGDDQKFVRGVWGTKAAVVFVGDDGKIFRYDAGSNDFTSVVSPTDAALWGVWGSRAGDVWIVGARELILHGSLE